MSLRKYKYVVKLTPGVQKKGKAGKACVEIFSRSKDSTPREHDLIKMMADNEQTLAKGQEDTQQQLLLFQISRNL